MSRFPLQFLDYKQPIVDPTTGLPTDYFLRLLFNSTEANVDTKSEAETAAGEAEQALAQVASKANKSLVLTAGTGLTGGGDLSADRTFALDPLAPDPSGSYTSSNITVDKFGRVIAAANGSGGGGGGAPVLFADVTVGTGVSEVVISGCENYTDLTFLIRDITASVSGSRCLTVSTDGGSTYISGTNQYLIFPSSGILSQQSVILFHQTGNAGARAGYIQINNNTDDGEQTFLQLAGNTLVGFIPNATDKITHVRLTNSAGGTMTGGRFWAWGRP
jgi:hypothetical protein